MQHLDRCKLYPNISELLDQPALNLFFLTGYCYISEAVAAELGLSYADVGHIVPIGDVIDVNECRNW